MAPRYTSIPEPTLKPESLRDSILSIKQVLEVLTGQRGNPNYRALNPADVMGPIENLTADIEANTAADAAAIAALNAPWLTYTPKYCSGQRYAWESYC